ncbi:MAG: ABC transporter substrate-binding protein [Sandaracinaceae bacterium]
MMLGLLTVVLGSCSLGVPQADSCADSGECRRAFGAGTYCAADTGRCESVINDLCPEIFPADVGDSPNGILLGSILNRDSENQVAREQAIQLAVQGIDERNGIDGRLVGVLHCNASQVSEAAAYLVDEVGVQVILGPSSSQDVEAVFTSHREDGVLVMTPSATAQQLEALDRPASGPGRLWRTAPPDTLQVPVILDELGEDVRASIIARQNDTYAQGLSIIVQEAAMTTTLEVVETPQFSDAEQIATAAANALGSGDAPDVVLFLSSEVADAARFLEAAAENPAYDSVQLFFSDAAANDELLTLTGDGPGAARYGNVRATRPSSPDTIITNEFVGAYQAVNGSDPLEFSFTAHAYDAAALVILGAGYATRDGGEVTGLRVAEGIRQLTTGPSRQLLSANFGSIISDIRAGTTVDLVGASGELDYDGTTEELSTASYDVLNIQGAGAGATFQVTRTVASP